MSARKQICLAAKLQRRNHANEYPEAATQAERFVDDVTHLRMMRLRSPLANPEISGSDSDTIKAVHLANGAALLERWQKEWGPHAIVDVAYRFKDGSIAIRIAATKRWEVMRTW